MTKLRVGERQTWYAVATVLLKRGTTYAVCCSHLFSIVGDQPLTQDEAKRRGEAHVREKWSTEKWGDIADYDLHVQAVDVQVVAYSVGSEPSQILVP